jgi:hypothetical protein
MQLLQLRLTTDLPVPIEKLGVKPVDIKKVHLANTPSSSDPVVQAAAVPGGAEL